jgi:broad specificity phosphatase PhoE
VVRVSHRRRSPANHCRAALIRYSPTVYRVRSGPIPAQQFVLVRHGQSHWNERKLIQGQNDEAQLTQKGREQARLALEKLREYSFDAIITSDLARARETAEVFATALGLTIAMTTQLRERSFGVYEGRPLQELPASLAGIEGGVVTDEEAHPEGGESLSALRARVGDFVDMLHRERPQERLLLVTHGGTIRALRAYCEGRAMLLLPWDRVANCSVWNVEVPRHERRVERE